MISIKQDSGADPYKVAAVANKLGVVDLNISLDTIDADIAKLNGMLSSDISKTTKTNIERTLNYIRGIKRKSKGEVKFSWGANDTELTSKPFELRDISQLGINTVDYVELTGEKMVRLDYTELSNILAFELMYRDLGETHVTMEEKLGHIGVTSISPSKLLGGIIDPKALELSKDLKVNSSPYLNTDIMEMYSYFYRGVATNRYRGAVRASCVEAIAVIITHILSKLIGLNVQVKLYNVSDTGFYISIPESQDVGILSELEYVVTVRTFGRRFEILPKIKVY